MSLKHQLKVGLIQYSKYAIIGLSCATIDLGVLNGLIYFFPTESNGWLIFYNSLAYSLAVLNSYIWNSRFTFKEQSKHNYKQFIAFVVQSLVSLMISDVVFIGALSLLKQTNLFPRWIDANAAKLLSMFLSSVASFFFNKFFVFRHKNVPSHDQV